MTGVLARVFAGRTDSFAIELDVRPDPDVQDSPVDDVWGSLGLWVDGKSLTAHIDRNEAFVAGITWTFGSMLEWLLNSWAERSHAFWRNHCLLAARDGGPMPNVAFLRRGDDIEIAWTGGDEAGTGTRYISSAGARLLPAAEVAAVLLEFVQESAAQLGRLAPAGERWSRIHSRVAQLKDQDGDSFSHRLGLLIGVADTERWHAALAGLGSDDRALVEATLSSSEWAAPGCLACPEPALMFGTLRPDPTEGDVGKLLSAWAAANVDSRRETGLDDLEMEGLDGFTQPFEQGIEAARHLRELLSWGEETLIDLENRVAALGVDIKDVSFDDRAIPAVAMCSEQTRPTILINSTNRAASRSWGRRMAIAHELGHLILDRDRARRIGIVDGPWAPTRVEQRARAFAAHLLMPGEQVLRFIEEKGLDPRDPEALARVGGRYGVSWRSAASHLVSLGLLNDIDEAEALLEDAVCDES
jgi:Zn-dependent peptidase ImmA (M78 family)